jgi:triphosphoribosyl-dephospho-CoA synthase
MRLAADRDLIARQYTTGYADIFAVGVRRIEEERRRGTDLVWTATLVFLDFLARFPDSHIARKFGAAAAESLRLSVAPLERRLAASENPAALSAELIALDAELKAAGMNPGTSADLTVASLFALRLEDAAAVAG